MDRAVSSSLTAVFIAILMPMIPIKSAFAGSESHGGDLHSDGDNPWFLNDANEAAPRPLKVCVSDSGNAPTDKQVSMVRQGLSQWRQFFKKYGLDTATFDDVIRAVHQSPAVAPSASLQLNLKFEFPDYQSPYVAQNFERYCDLSVVFLTTNSPVLGELRVGQALRLERQAQVATGAPALNPWSFRGIIHVKEQDDSAITNHLLMHELGHAFGMVHNSVPIMDEDTVDRALRGYPESLGQIETKAWKLAFLPGDTVDLTAGKACGGTEAVEFQENMGWYLHSGYRYLQILPGIDPNLTSVCLGFKLQYLELEPIPFGGYMRKLRLTMMLPNQVEHSFIAWSRVNGESSIFAGPSLYAVYHGWSFEPEAIATKRYQKLFNDGYTSEGVLEVGSKKISMVISFYRGPDNQRAPGNLPNLSGDKGIRIKILNPDTLEWVTIK